MKASLAALCLAAAAFGADGVAGHYVLVGVHEVGSEMVLKADGSFEYFLAYGAADYMAKGKWRLDGDAVVLNTSGEAGAPFRLVRSSPGEEGGVRIVVKGLGGAPVQHIEVALKSAESQRKGKTNSAGAAEFPEPKAPASVAFRVPVYDVEGGPFELNPAHRLFEFEINGEAITRVPFKDERLKVAGEYLEMRFWDKSKVMRYHRE